MMRLETTLPIRPSDCRVPLGAYKGLVIAYLPAQGDEAPRVIVSGRYGYATIAVDPEIPADELLAHDVELWQEVTP